MLRDKRVLVTGGTGSIGNVLVRRLLSGEVGLPSEIVVFSRDEAKQHSMRLALDHREVATDDVIYEQRGRVRFQIGDVADYRAVSPAVRNADVIFHAAALKQVPTCEYFPLEAVRTNVLGADNIVRAIQESDSPVNVVVGISTDKACKPVNVMGMTKALQERLLVRANVDCPRTRFVVARYGNVLASRGSAIPLFHDQIRKGGPLTLTTKEMTRFLMSLDQAVDTIFAACAHAAAGETYVLRVPSAHMVDIAAALIGERQIDMVSTGIRPGEKVHEILVSEEESPRTVRRGEYLVIKPILPQLRAATGDQPYDEIERSSAHDALTRAEVEGLLRKHRLMIEDSPLFL
ncbi:MAG: polysaccharide biosynthesis protein [Acidobacteriota bacterium]